MPDPDPTRRKLLNCLQAKLLESLSLVAELPAPLVVDADDGVYKASMLVGPVDGPSTGHNDLGGLPTPRPYSPSESAVMLAIGPHGAKLAKEFFRVTGLKAEDPRFKQIIRGLRDRGVLGHCVDGYFWPSTNPNLGDDEDSSPV